MPAVDRWKRRALRRQSGLPVTSCAWARITAAKRLASKFFCGRAPSGGRVSIPTTVDLTPRLTWRGGECSKSAPLAPPRSSGARRWPQRLIRRSGIARLSDLHRQGTSEPWSGVLQGGGPGGRHAANNHSVGTRLHRPRSSVPTTASPNSPMIIRGVRSTPKRAGRRPAIIPAISAWPR